MAELIEKDALSEEIESLTVHVTGLRAGKGVLSKFMDEYRNSVLRIIDEQPTTTEAEIRKKAIDEFVGKLLEEVEANPVDVGGRYSYMIPQSFLEGQIKDIAEQLKEE